MKKNIGFLLFLLSLFITTACQAEVSVSATATTIPSVTPPVFITATLPATQTPQILPTLPIAPSATENPPVEGQTTAQVNIRSAPSEGGEQVGMIEIFAKVEIIGTDPSANWWLILFPESPQGRGWVAKEFVQVADSTEVPVITTESTNASQASITEASSNAGDAVPTSEPTSVLATAPEDGDSAQNPAINLTLSEISISYFEHSSELSAPEGDGDDWVQFSLSGDAGQEKIVSVIVDCSGSGKLNLELVQNGVILESWEELDFARHQFQLYLYVGAPYSLHFSPDSNGTVPKYISYKLSVQLMK